MKNDITTWLEVFFTTYMELIRLGTKHYTPEEHQTAVETAPSDMVKLVEILAKTTSIDMDTILEAVKNVTAAQKQNPGADA